jgi:hypothetical protein
MRHKRILAILDMAGDSSFISIQQNTEMKRKEEID